MDRPWCVSQRAGQGSPVRRAARKCRPYQSPRRNSLRSASKKPANSKEDLSSP